MMNHIFQKLAVFMVLGVTLITMQNCDGTVIRDPLSVEPDRQETVSRFKAFDTHPFDEDNVFTPGETVTPHIVSLSLCLTGFKLEVVPGTTPYPIFDQIIDLALNPEGTDIGFFSDVPEPDGVYDGLIGFRNLCDTGYSVRIENGNGVFESTELIRPPVPIEKITNSEGKSYYEVDISAYVEALSQVSHQRDIICAFGDLFSCREP